MYNLAPEPFLPLPDSPRSEVAEKRPVRNHNGSSRDLAQIETTMQIVNYHVRFPGPFERERIVLEMIHHIVRIVYITVLIVGSLLVLGGIAA